MFHPNYTPIENTLTFCKKQQQMKSVNSTITSQIIPLSYIYIFKISQFKKKLFSRGEIHFVEVKLLTFFSFEKCPRKDIIK